MIVNGSSIQGIFKYNDNYTFEKGDLVVSLVNKALYYVNTAQVQGVDPGTVEGLKYYIPYSRTQEVTSVEQIDDPKTYGTRLVTASMLAQYFTGLMGGIGSDGSIDIIDYDAAEIALMKTNQVHYVRQAEGSVNVEVGDQLDTFPLAGKDFLLRVYKTRNFSSTGEYCAIQEFIDFVNGVFLYRYANISSNTTTPSWSAFRYIGTSKENISEDVRGTLNARFNSYKELVDQVVSKINFIQQNLTNFYSFYEATESNAEIGMFFIKDATPPVLSITNNFLNGRGSIIIAFLSYNDANDLENKVTYKESVYINPFASGTILTQNFRIEITTIPGTSDQLLRTDITFIPFDTIKNLKLDKAIASMLSSLNIDIGTNTETYKA